MPAKGRPLLRPWPNWVDFVLMLGVIISFAALAILII